MTVQTLEHDTPMMLGKPARPFPEHLTSAIAAVIRRTQSVVEAHLALCFIPGTTPQAQPALFLLLKSGIDPDQLIPQLQVALASLLIIPIEPDSRLLPAIRNAGCALPT